jgi:hypothetical protein
LFSPEPTLLCLYGVKLINTSTYGYLYK